MERAPLPPVPYSEAPKWMYMDWSPMRPGPVKRFHTNCPAPAKSPVESFWNCVSI